MICVVALRLVLRGRNGWMRRECSHVTGSISVACDCRSSCQEPERDHRRVSPMSFRSSLRM